MPPPSAAAPGSTRLGYSAGCELDSDTVTNHEPPNIDDSRQLPTLLPGLLEHLALLLLGIDGQLGAVSQGNRIVETASVQIANLAKVPGAE